MSGKTILVVDDEPANIDLLVGTLKERYTVKAARNGELALKICHLPEPPDVVLLDISMPEMDGYEVCRRLKADAATAKIPVIFFSSEEGVRPEEHGALAALPKPAEPGQVMTAIDAALQSSRE